MSLMRLGSFLVSLLASISLQELYDTYEIFNELLTVETSSPTCSSVLTTSEKPLRLLGAKFGNDRVSVAWQYGRLPWKSINFMVDMTKMSHEITY